MYEELNRALYAPRIVWSVDIGRYGIRCWYRQDPPGTFTIVVAENDVELHRSIIYSDDPAGWQQAWTTAADLRLAFEHRISPGVRKLSNASNTTTAADAVKSPDKTEP